MWFNKFARLAYIAYLNVEKEIRDFALFVVGAGIGMFLLFVSMMVLLSPADYSFMVEFAIIAGLWNALLVLLLLAIWGTLIGFTVSMVRMAYIYDGKSWGYARDITDGVDRINMQLDRDRNEVLAKRRRHENEMMYLVEQMKKSESQKAP